MLSKKIRNTFKIRGQSNCYHPTKKLLVSLSALDHIELLKEMADKITFEKHLSLVFSLNSDNLSSGSTDLIKTESWITNHELLEQIFSQLIPLETKELSLLYNADNYFDLNSIIYKFHYLVGRVQEQVLLSGFKFTATNLTELCSYLYKTQTLVLDKCKYIPEEDKLEETKDQKESIEQAKVVLTQITFWNLDYADDFVNLESILNYLDMVSKKLGRNLIISFERNFSRFDSEAVQKYIHNHCLMLELKNN